MAKLRKNMSYPKTKARQDKCDWKKQERRHHVTEKG